MAWVVLMIGTILKQTVIILTSKDEKPRLAVVKNEPCSTDAKQFKIKADGFKEIRKQILMRSILLMLISGTVGLLIFAYSPVNKANPEINVLPFLIPLLLVIFTWGIFKAVKRQMNIYKSYELKIDETGITRQQASTPTISMLFTEIKSITKNKLGMFVITGESRTNMIIVPAQLEGLEVVMNIIQANCTLPIGSQKPLRERLTLLYIFILMGLMAIIYLSTNKILVTISGLLLIAFMVYAFINIQTNKNIDDKIRRNSYWAIVVILAYIGMIVSRLMS